MTYFDDGDVRLYCADALETLRELPDQSVHMACTSPPFFGLRDYGTGTWEGGDGGCDHETGRLNSGHLGDVGPRNEDGDAFRNSGRYVNQGDPTPAICGKCGARRIDNQIGLESSPDEWAARLVDVFREVRRVLRDDGTLFIEIGDSYASALRGGAPSGSLGTERPDSPGCDCACHGLGDESPTSDSPATADHSRRTSQPPPESASPDAKRGRSTARRDSLARASVGSQPLDVLASTTHGGEPSRPLTSHAEDEASRAEQPTPVQPSSLDARPCGCSSACIDGTSQTQPSSAGRNSDRAASGEAYHSIASASLKPKDLIMQPHLLAFALRADGWYLRSCIIWSKPNCMPESVTDRPTTAHSYVFLLSKKPRYFYDAEALREPDAGLPSGNGFAGRQGAARDTVISGGPGADERFVPGGGKNARSVWTIPTEPNALAICRVCDAFWQGGAPREHCGQPVVQHFAAFPRELVRRMILAGTSERGVCAECGAPWVREVERESAPREVMTRRNAPNDGFVGSGRARVDGELLGKGAKLQRWRDEHPPQTLGWHPSCECGYADFVNSDLAGQKNVITRPATILDCFAGSGTSLLVARQHGRHAIGIELNERYAAMCKARMSQLSLFSQEPATPRPVLQRLRGLTGGAYNPPGQSPHSNAR